MSELINRRLNQLERSNLLATASAAALFVGLSLTGAYGKGESGSVVWIELEGDLQKIDGGQEALAPPFLLSQPRPILETISPIKLQSGPRYSNGGGVKLELHPEDSDWSFSASIRYGRANKKKAVHEQSTARAATVGGARTAYGVNYENTRSRTSLSNAIVDFQVGKDVGLGLFGKPKSTVVAAGIRFAQFNSHTTTNIAERPDYGFAPYTFLFGTYAFHALFPHRHDFHASSSAGRSFQGIGPSVSLVSSIPMAGSAEGTKLFFDWGLNGALLFGRQKALVLHKSAGHYYKVKRTGPFSSSHFNSSYAHSGSPERRRSITVPNIGGFAGLSFRYDAAKVSLGYRADFFFGAMDGGIDARKTYDRNFYGPFATISIGLP